MFTNEGTEGINKHRAHAQDAGNGAGHRGAPSRTMIPPAVLGVVHCLTGELE